MSAKKQTAAAPRALADALREGLKNNKLLYAAAPTGWGKTTSVRHYFRAQPHTYVSFRDEGALARAEGDGTGLLILDDCHLLLDRPKLQERLCTLLRALPAEGRAVLLSRAPLPEWLLPFRLSGLLDVLDSRLFALGTGDTARLAERMGVVLSQEDVLRLTRESLGHPMTLRLLCLELLEGKPLNTDTVRRACGTMFAYLDRELFDYWDARIRRLLLSVSFFPRFTVDLARCLTGDPQTERTLGRLLRISSFIDPDGDGYAIRYGPFREYLRRKAEAAWSHQEIDALYANAGMYFQLHGDLPAALDCWSAGGNHAKVSELLAEHSRQHPGHGVYYQLRKYYRSLPEAEVLSSPELMCGMSILCSLTFDVEGSEKWYNALKDRADALPPREPERKKAQGLVTYLNIALPHRGSVQLGDILLSAYDLLLRGDVSLPEFSVTSNLPSVLRGGKDFSAWVTRDKLLYDTVASPVSAVLGRQGVGLPEIALTESRYEKGEDISGAFLTLSSCRAEIQRRGAPETEFVLTALLARCQCDLGNAERAREDLTAFRARMENEGQQQLLPNIDAMLCRVDLLHGGEYAHKWFTEEAPDENDFFIMERYRYLTKARCYLQRGELLTTLALLGRLLDYFDRYGRTLDQVEALILLAVCRQRMEAEDWQNCLTAALELAEQYGYVRVFAHQGAALLPLLRAWKPSGARSRMKDYLPRVRKAVAAFAAQYPRYLTSGGPVAIQDLTGKELEILRLMCQGKSRLEMGELLNVTENTLKTHTRKLFRKLGVSSRSEAVAAAQKLHLS